MFVKESEPVPTMNPRTELSIENIEILPCDINAAFDRLEKNTSPGPDDILSVTLLEVRFILAPILLTLFSKFLTESYVPKSWRLANVTPIFKSGDKVDPNNYRGISLTCLMGKMLEYIIKEKVTQFLIKNKLISNVQDGFLKGRSCLTSHLKFYNQIYNWVDLGRPVDILYLDYKKAFDLVVHSRLIVKLRAYGIGGCLINWIISWLYRRKQRVVYGGDTSSWSTVESGVMQGTVLGPLLFQIFINDLETDLQALLAIFADDSKIAYTVDSAEDVNVLKTSIINIEKWAEKWQMTFNVSKCKIMHVGNNNLKNDYELFGQSITKVNQINDLGAVISDNLKTSSHWISQVSKSNKLIGLISRSFEFKNINNILMLYKSLIRPHIEQYTQFLYPYLQTDINRIEKVQRNVTRLIPNYKFLEYEERLNLTGLQSLEKRRIRTDLILVYKILNGLTDMANFNGFEEVNNNTRNNGNKIKSIFKFKKNSYKNFFFNRVPGAWNSLPENITKAHSLATFKKLLDSYMISNNISYFYSM